MTDDTKPLSPPGSPQWIEEVFRHASKVLWDKASRDIEDAIAEASRDDHENKLYEREVG